MKASEYFNTIKNTEIRDWLFRLLKEDREVQNMYQAIECCEAENVDDIKFLISQRIKAHYGKL